MRQIYLESYFKKGYNRLMNYISNIAHLLEKDRAVILERLKIIEFFEEFGEEATKKAFDKGRSVIFLWKQKVKTSGGYLSALKPDSKAPKIHPKRKTNEAIVDFILQYRQSHPGVDKVTIKPALDAFCSILGLNLVSESTIGRIIEELKKQGVIAKTWSHRGLAEEAPIAYKNIDDVINVVSKAELAHQVAKLRPLIVVKG